MTASLPSPCISACSLPPGAGVCHGCKRRLDEIANWAQFDDTERAQVWQRLNRQTAQLIDAYVRIEDEARLRHFCASEQLKVPPCMAIQGWVWMLLRACRNMRLDYAEAGLVPLPEISELTPKVLFLRLDAELQELARQEALS